MNRIRNPFGPVVLSVFLAFCFALAFLPSRLVADPVGGTAPDCYNDHCKDKSLLQCYNCCQANCGGADVTLCQDACDQLLAATYAVSRDMEQSEIVEMLQSPDMFTVPIDVEDVMLMEWAYIHGDTSTVRWALVTASDRLLHGDPSKRLTEAMKHLLLTAMSDERDARIRITAIAAVEESGLQMDTPIFYELIERVHADPDERVKHRALVALMRAE